MKHSILDFLQAHAQNSPDKVAFEFLNDSGQGCDSITFAEMHEQARVIAENLSNYASPGDTVLLLYPPGIEYIKSFVACLFAGLIAVPLYTPKKTSKSERVVNVATSAASKLALTTQKEINNVKAYWKSVNNVKHKLTFYATDGEQVTSNGPVNIDTSKIDVTLPAFLQYTSGSTSIPKGVIITHQNLLANVQYLETMAKASYADVFVNWLPLFHDLGLVTSIMLPLYLGSTSVLMAPTTFIRNPFNWLKAMHDYNGTIGGAPNFAYDLCTDKVKAEDLATIDLSKWRVAYNAAEPVSYLTLKRFKEKFEAYGFDACGFYPSFGMAESVAFVTGGQVREEPSTVKVSKRKLAENKLEIVTDESDKDTLHLVSCGYAGFNHELKIVDPKTQGELAEGCIGEIAFFGPSVSPGYWQLDNLSQKSFNNCLDDNAPEKQYLLTGDLGFIWLGELFVTGRMKDLIILRGRNYYPQDIEMSTKLSHPSIRQGYSAAFSIDDKKLVLITELNRESFRNVDYEEVKDAIRETVFKDFELNIDDILLLPPYKIPMTTSGKIQRRQTKQLYVQEMFTALGSEVKTVKHVKPDTQTEQVVHDLWAEVLNIEQISTTSNFVNLGGDSIKAIQLFDSIQKVYPNLTITQEKLFEIGTIKEIAELIELSQTYLNVDIANNSEAKVIAL